MPAMRQTERARLFQRAKQALRARREQEERVKEKTSRYLQAGAPLRCFCPRVRSHFSGHAFTPTTGASIVRTNVPTAGIKSICRALSL